MSTESSERRLPLKISLVIGSVSLNAMRTRFYCHNVRRSAKAVDFYKAAFGAIEAFRIEGGDGSVVARLSVGGAEFWVGEESPVHKISASSLWAAHDSNGFNGCRSGCLLRSGSGDRSVGIPPVSNTGGEWGESATRCDRQCAKYAR